MSEPRRTLPVARLSATGIEPLIDRHLDDHLAAVVAAWPLLSESERKLVAGTVATMAKAGSSQAE